MPLTGTREVGDLLGQAPVVPALDASEVELTGAEVLQVLYEIDDSAMTSLLPPALHPTIPPTLYFNVTRVKESRWGQFLLAEVRVGCRSGARPRALLVRGYCNSPQAVDALRATWGYPVQAAEISLVKGYDRAEATVVASAGGVVLQAALMNPEAIGGKDIQYISSLNAARVTREGSEQPRLIQVDPEYVFHNAERGKPMVSAFQPEAWGLEGARLTWPVSASYATCDITMPTIRYLVNPALPVLQSVERV